MTGIARYCFFPPSGSVSNIVKYLVLMVETVQMAFLALIISVLISFPVAFFASRNTLEIIFPGHRPVDSAIRKIAYMTTRFFANLTRSINELVWALIFRLKVIRYAVIPQISPFFVSMILYRFESDVRAATILGFTGAGGIGVYLFDKLRSYENRDVTTIIIIIIITVALVDRLSAGIRKRYT